MARLDCEAGETAIWATEGVRIGDGSCATVDVWQFGSRRFIRVYTCCSAGSPHACTVPMRFALSSSFIFFASSSLSASRLAACSSSVSPAELTPGPTGSTIGRMRTLAAVDGLDESSNSGFMLETLHSCSSRSRSAFFFATRSLLCSSMKALSLSGDAAGVDAPPPATPWPLSMFFCAAAAAAAASRTDEEVNPGAKSTDAGAVYPADLIAVPPTPPDAAADLRGYLWEAAHRGQARLTDGRELDNPPAAAAQGFPRQIVLDPLGLVDGFIAVAAVGRSSVVDF